MITLGGYRRIVQSPRRPSANAFTLMRHCDKFEAFNDRRVVPLKKLGELETED
jgi:hypothetical protein